MLTQNCNLVAAYAPIWIEGKDDGDDEDGDDDDGDDDGDDDDDDKNRTDRQEWTLSYTRTQTPAVVSGRKKRVL